MIQRRTVLASLSAITVWFVPGCLSPITGRFGSDRPNLSDKNKEIIGIYEDGIDESNTGTEAWGSGITAFNESEYRQAVEDFDDAVTHFEGAKGLFAEARNMAREIGEDAAAQLCADAVEHAGLMVDAANAARDGAQAAENGESASKINDHIEKARELEEEGSDIEIKDPNVLATELTTD